MALMGALRTERYGYTLRASLAEAGVAIEERALYPMRVKEHRTAAP